MELENIPTVPILCTGFENIAKTESQRLGMPEMGWVLVKYPVAGLPPEELKVKAELAYPKIVDILTRNDVTGDKIPPPFVTDKKGEETIWLSGDTINHILERLNTSFIKFRWSDGLPLVPPTQKVVDEMLKGVALPPEEVIGLLYPNQGKATVKKIAINGVMAGCKPEYMPILVAAIKAMTTPEYHQESTLVSTGSFFPVVIVNGPIVKELNINTGRNAFGPCWRANATIGRAIRLMIINIGGSWPDLNDMSVMGHPGKFTCCIAENVESSLWPSLSEELGYSQTANTVTVYPGLMMGYMTSTGGPNPEDILQPLCEQICSVSSTISITPTVQTLVVLNPFHAKKLYEMGLSKQDVKQYIYENTRFSSEKYLKMVKLASLEDSKVRKIFCSWPGSTVPMFDSPDRIRVIVVGAEGVQSSFIRGFFGNMVTCEVPL